MGFRLLGRRSNCSCRPRILGRIFRPRFQRQVVQRQVYRPVTQARVIHYQPVVHRPPVETIRQQFYQNRAITGVRQEESTMTEPIQYRAKAQGSTGSNTAVSKTRTNQQSSEKTTTKGSNNSSSVGDVSNTDTFTRGNTERTRQTDNSDRRQTDKSNHSDNSNRPIQIIIHGGGDNTIVLDDYEVDIEAERGSTVNTGRNTGVIGNGSAGNTSVLTNEQKSNFNKWVNNAVTDILETYNSEENPVTNFKEAVKTLKNQQSYLNNPSTKISNEEKHEKSEYIKKAAVVLAEAADRVGNKLLANKILNDLGVDDASKEKYSKEAMQQVDEVQEKVIDDAWKSEKVDAGAAGIKKAG